jgi:hypothetical protein
VDLETSEITKINLKRNFENTTLKKKKEKAQKGNFQKGILKTQIAKLKLQALI